MVFGTFDNLHPGHLSYFSQAQRFGDELIAVVARDKTVLQVKGRLPQEPEKTRLKKVRAALKNLGTIKPEAKKTGRAVLGSLTNQWLVLKKYRPAIICLGYDQLVDLVRLKREIAQFRLFSKIKRLKAYYPENYKSSYCRAK